MTDTTIGQRIAERRKLLNLSQEALGDKVGVSRQAISKWESDAAVPEIDKLIAMSKLFSVSVGWLLGTESEIAAERTETFLEEQLHLVEEIVKRYHQPPAKSNNLTLWKILACFGMLAALICFVSSMNPATIFLLSAGFGAANFSVLCLILDRLPPKKD